MLKALADDSRYAIFSELGRGEPRRGEPGRGAGPLSTVELARRLELHPNTVRLHLERLREAGLVRSASESHGSVGRPQLLWSLVPDAPLLGLEPDGFRVLAHLLADALAASVPRSAALVAVGRRAGEVRVGAAGSGPRPRRRRRTRTSGGAARRLTTRSGAAALPTATPDRADADVVAGQTLEAVIAELADLGFDPLVEPAGASGAAGASVVFTGCPFRELATSYPDLVCALHRGVTEGIVAAVAGRRPGVSASVTAFSTLVDADPCRAEVTVRAAGGSAVAAATAPGPG